MDRAPNTKNFNRLDAQWQICILALMKLLFQIKEIEMVSHNVVSKVCVLASTYRKFDTPVDSLATNPAKLAEFAEEMNRNGFPWTPEVTLTELFRARKSGRLPKIRRVP